MSVFRRGRDSGGCVVRKDRDSGGCVFLGEAEAVADECC